MQTQFHNPKSEIRASKSTGRKSPRRGFTLMELLIVITIIAILMSLVIQVIGSFITQARDSATKSTVEKNQGLLNSRAQAFNRLIMRKGYVSGSVELQAVRLQGQYQNLPTTAQTTLATKYLEMKFFPQSISDLVTLNGMSSQVGGPYPVLSSPIQPLGIYQQMFSQKNPPGQSISNLGQYDPTKDANHALRSSEILYHFLTQSNVLGTTPVGADAFTGAEVTDTPEIVDPATGKLIGNGLPEFIDAWGNPLRFYRWPTRFFRSGGTLANFTATDLVNAKLLFSSLPVFSGNLMIIGTPNGDLSHDPDDPLQNCVSIPNFEQNFHTPATYHVLLIVSAGPDGKLGMCEPDSIDPYTNNIVPFGNLALPSAAPDYQDQLSDNIMYLNVRAGGK